SLVRRHAGRPDEGAPNAYTRIEEFDRLTIFRRAGKVVHEGNILEFGVGRGGALEKDGDLLAGDPVGTDFGYAGEVLADAVHLAALHGEQYGRGGLKSADDFEPHAE